MDKRQAPRLLKPPKWIPNSGAVSIAVLYLLIGWLWILLSDEITVAIARTYPARLELQTTISLVKGLGYVLVTAVLLGWLIQRHTAALRASETQLQQVIDALPVLISYVDTGERYRFTNNLYEQWFGAMTHGKTVQEVVGPETYQTVSKYIQKALQGETVSYEHALSLPFGERFVTATYIPDKAADGQIKGFFALVQDITESKRAETAVLESSLQFRTLFEASPDANMLIDPHGDWPILDCNTAACQMNGYTHAELIGQPIDILNPKPWRPPKRDEYLANIRQAGVLRYETVHRRKDGTEFSIEVSTSLISLNGHEVLLGIDRDITERKRAEENLRRFELLSEHSRDVILFMGRDDGRILEANAAAARTYGYSRAELLAFTIHDLRADEAKGLTARQLAQADSSGILFETVHRRKDGTTFPAEVSSRGATIGGERTLISIVRDVTERKRVQAAALENELRYHRVLDTMMEGCQIIDFNWRYVYVNQVVTQQGRHTAEELLGHTMMEIYPGIENTELFASLRRCMEERVPERLENRFVFPDGSIGLFELSIQPVEEGLFILSTDITERKRAERELRESQVRLNFALEKSHTGGWDLDLVDHTALRTLEHDRIFGYGSLLPEWTYEIFLEHVIPEDRAEVDRLFQEAVRTQTNWSFECRIRRKDGEIRWIWAVGGHLFDDSGQAYRMAGIVQDITERKQAEQEIRLLNERLEQRVIERTAQLESANKELEAFSYSVSHDLRAPLRAIDGYTRILVEDYEASLDEEGKRICGIISAEARRMGQLIDDLLAFSRLGRKAMYLSKVDMKAMATSIFDELLKGEDQGRIDFQVTRLPVVEADASLIRQVWVNLLSNAIKFTSKKEHALIKVGTKQSSAEYVYYVHDTGAGFDMEYVDKLFGVFQRLHGESEFEGTGVGLAIVQRIIRRHGGRVWAEGEPEKGATFYFSLPRQETPRQDSPPQETSYE